jgi:P-type E1-E2 ATPase
MLCIEIPGWGRLEVAHLLCDLNGTLAVDGRVSAAVADRLSALRASLDIHIATADTFGTAGRLAGLGARVQVLGPGDQTAAKAAIVRALGASGTVVVGNGRNDAAMLREAALGIAILGREGAAPQTLLAADVVVARIEDALDLLLHPKRLAATLRTL